MLILISPAKTLDFNKSNIKTYSLPQLLDKSNELINTLKQKSVDEIATLMKLSQKLSTLNVQRFNDYHTPFNLNNAKQAILAFKGDVYTAINVDSFSKNDINFINDSVRILSGLYGILRPLDLIQAYRLEMGTKLLINQYKNLYQFWGDTISENLNTYKNEIIINLASNEYYKVINPKIIINKIINIVFKEKTDKGYKIIGIHAKRARGLMVNYIVKNRIINVDDLKQFNVDNYCFNDDFSDDLSWVFTR